MEYLQGKKKCPGSCFDYFSLFSSNFYIADIWGEEAGAMLPRYYLLLPHFKINSVHLILYPLPFEPTDQILLGISITSALVHLTQAMS